MVLLQADEIFSCLERHRVLYVVIGGLAAVLHGSPLATFDADICPKADAGNRERLAALRELDARIRTPDVPGGLRFSCNAAFLERASASWTSPSRRRDRRATRISRRPPSA